MELYLHFPFCRKKCAYCDFASFAGQEERMPAYIEALIAEAKLRAADCREPIDTVFAGGGRLPCCLRFFYPACFVI